MPLIFIDRSADAHYCRRGKIQNMTIQNVQENVPLAPLTTFAIGGEAKYFVEVTNKNDLGAALDYAQIHTIPFFLLAGGSNILVADEGFNGLVIKIAFDTYTVHTDTGEVSAEAGCSLMEIVKEASTANLTGMEALYGIPGSVGGALRGNAGAFGTEMLDVVNKVEALNIQTREVKIFNRDECHFSYRNSFFKESKDWIILSVIFTLTQSSTVEPMQEAERILALRNDRQIQGIQSAGSFFVNPEVAIDVQETFKEEKGLDARENRVPAGWLIDRVGFKGVCKNAVCTGVRSANYIINQGGASAASVRSFTKEIQNEVTNKLGIELIEEVTTVGF